MEDAKSFDIHQRLLRGLFIFESAYRPFVERKMHAVFGSSWMERSSFSRGAEPRRQLDAYALLKTTLDQWNAVFRDVLKQPVRNRVSLVLEARNRVAHSEPIDAADALVFLKAMFDVIDAVGAKEALAAINELTNQQLNAIGNAAPQPVPPPLAEPRVSKAEAIRRVNRRCNLAVLDNRNTNFANVNRARPDLWWFDIPVEKVDGHDATDTINLGIITLT